MLAASLGRVNGDRGDLGYPLFGRGQSAATCACTGATCEDVLAPCAGGPCKNGGECRESEDYESFSCSCPPGWQGGRCCQGTALLRAVVGARGKAPTPGDVQQHLQLRVPNPLCPQVRRARSTSTSA